MHFIAACMLAVAGGIATCVLAMALLHGVIAALLHACCCCMNIAMAGGIFAHVIAACVLSLRVGYSPMNITAAASIQHVLLLRHSVIP